MKTATEITATAIYKIKDQPCWYVPSDTVRDKMYKVCFDSESVKWNCTCPAGEHGRVCKHARAVMVSIQANKEQEAHRIEVERQIEADLAIHIEESLEEDPWFGMSQEERENARCNFEMSINY